VDNRKRLGELGACEAVVECLKAHGANYWGLAYRVSNSEQ
jgi:hypothetical protein